MTVLMWSAQILVTLKEAYTATNGSLAASLFGGLPAEVWFMILSLADYRTLVLMALSCKGLAFAILNSQAFQIAAATEEAAHKELGHYEYVTKRTDRKSESRSKLYCSHFLCPFYMKNIWTWAKNVKMAAKKLEEEHKKALEPKDVEGRAEDKGTLAKGKGTPSEDKGTPAEGEIVRGAGVSNRMQIDTEILIQILIEFPQETRVLASQVIRVPNNL
jgi:hypothetical protein